MESSVVARKTDEPGAKARAKCDIKFRGLENFNHGNEKGELLLFVILFFSLYGVLSSTCVISSLYYCCYYCYYAVSAPVQLSLQCLSNILPASKDWKQRANDENRGPVG